MKTNYRTGKRVGLSTILLLFLALLVLVPAAHAAIVFDDFEDGDHEGWLVGTNGGSGSTGVVDHNESLMAHVYHSGTYHHSLSLDFGYAPTHELSFDMHAIAVYGGRGTHAGAGVTISFLDSFNRTLGYVSLLNHTDPGSLGTYSIPIDNVQHHYENELSDYLSIVGLDDSAPIETVSLSFFASAQSYFSSNHSTANVWFDNVTVEAVPLPPAFLLFGSALIGLVGIKRRRR